MASSLSTLYTNFEPIPPYTEVTTTKEVDEVAQTVTTGGVISNFNNIVVDKTILDLSTSQVKAFPINSPLPIQRIGGSTSLYFVIPLDTLINSSSIDIISIYAINKTGADGSSVALVKEDGIVPVNGFYPLQNSTVAFDNAQITDSSTENLDLTILRDLKLCEKIKNGSLNEMKTMHETYAGWHINRQSYADSKIGDFGAYAHTADTHVITAISNNKSDPTDIYDDAFNFQQDNIHLMLGNELTCVVELDNTFLNKTRIAPFVSNKIEVIVKWNNVGNICAQEQPVPAAKAGVWNTLHYVLLGAYVQFQTVTPSKPLIDTYSTVTVKSPKEIEKEVKNNTPVAFPSWTVQTIHKYDNKNLAKEQSSIILNLKGRMIPDIIYTYRERFPQNNINNFFYSNI